MKFLRPLPALAALAVLALPLAAFAKPWWMRGAAADNENDFLAPDAAFRVAAELDGSQVRVRWRIADGYYLYRRRMEIKAESPNLTVSDPTFPSGTMKTDPYLGTQEIYTQQVAATATYTRADGGAHPVQIKVVYQGCAEAGLCYPPISKVLFPTAAETTASGATATSLGSAASTRRESVAIVGGGLAFLLAGWVLRKGRRLAMPA